MISVLWHLVLFSISSSIRVRSTVNSYTQGLVLFFASVTGALETEDSILEPVLAREIMRIWGVHFQWHFTGLWYHDRAVCPKDWNHLREESSKGLSMLLRLGTWTGDLNRLSDKCRSGGLPKYLRRSNLQAGRPDLKFQLFPLLLGIPNAQN